GTSFEDLVEEAPVRLGQLARGDSAVLVLLQAGDADRAEQLLGGGEPGEQAGERPAAGPPHDGFQQHALGAGGRADKQDALPGERGWARAVALRVALARRGRQLGAGAGERVPDRVGVGSGHRWVSVGTGERPLDREGRGKGCRAAVTGEWLAG